MLKNLTKGVSSAVHSSIDSISPITETASTLLSDNSKTLSSNPLQDASMIVSETPTDTSNIISSDTLLDTTSKTISSSDTLTDASKVVTDTLTDTSNIISSDTSKIADTSNIISSDTMSDTANILPKNILQDSSKIISSDPLQEVSSTISLDASKITSYTTDLIPNASKVSSSLTTITNTLNPLIDITNSATLIKTLGCVLKPTLLPTLLTSLLSLLPSFLQNLVSISIQQLGLLITHLWPFIRRPLILGLILLLILIGLVITGLIIFMPLIIITSPIWVPTGTFIFLIIATFLSIFGFSTFVVCTLLWAYRYYKGRNQLRLAESSNSGSNLGE